MPPTLQLSIPNFSILAGKPHLLLLLFSFLHHQPLTPLFSFSHRNTNGPNTFTGLNITSFTSGLFPAENFFTKKDSFACFAYQFAAQAKPDLLGALDVVTGQIPSLTSQVKALMGELEGCSQLRGVDEELLMQFQGYRRSKGEGIVKRF